MILTTYQTDDGIKLGIKTEKWHTGCGGSGGGNRRQLSSDSG